MNAQGTKLLNFVSDIRGCIVNGRIDCSKNDYTSITTHKGLAVVDYHITRLEDLNTITSMAVVSCIELLSGLNKQHLISHNSRLPDLVCYV